MSQDPKLTPPPGGYPPPGTYPPPASYQPSPPPKKKRTGLKITVMVFAAFVLVVVVAGITGGGNKPSSPTAPTGGTTGTQQPAVAPPATTQAPAVHHVVYQITGSGGATHASITYNSDGGTSTSQDQDDPLPWKTTLDVPAGQFSVATLLAQNKAASGTVTCTITVDGKVIKTASGNGAYAIASCSGTIEGF